ncbi:hypothetical protein [Winogradskyella vincentii]|uniref:Glycosyltransferase RgtA/B/C/D-like domain-containing protein n=1 Tax=Winogradskyella vincentii TaxID=2877122 RepID=A0ABS7Y1D0_9FLAO|nr:hypothetical protein [Winogradskyella vincentii]MCA0153738.1 hypothetical protein [Winogradskyella vincentii]
MPLIADETTYNKIASNILLGKYYLKDYPSTVTPIIPFVLAFFKTTVNPIIGLTLHKLLHIFLAVLGFRYLYLFLLNLNLKKSIVLAIVALAAVNPIGITFFGRLYPEGILMFSFWGFIYYASAKVKTSHFIKMLLLFVILVLTRYLYAILGVIILYNCYRYYLNLSKKKILKLLKYSVIIALPVLLWLKYVNNIEQNNLSEISYFSRFKAENPLMYNIKAGLGIIKHDEVNKVNGIPAFASLFVPIDGFRNYILSVGLIIAFLAGYLSRKLPLGSKILVISIVLTMLGLIFAGTGFSRYWLILLPGFLLGYYYLASKLKIPDKWILIAVYSLCIIYVINEFRLDYLILNRYL